MPRSLQNVTMAQSLYEVFILPALAVSKCHALRKPPPISILRVSANRRHLSQSSVRFASDSSLVTKPRDPRYRPPVERRPRDNEIQYRIIDLVDPQSAVSGPRRTTRYDALRSYDPKTHYLEQITENYEDDPQFVPLCRIINKKEAYDKAKARRLQSKESKKNTAIASASGMKTIEMSWAISEGDLGHRLDKLKGFLEEGRRVELALAKKKGGRRATVDECEALLTRIRDCVESVDGAKELKDADADAGEKPMKLGGLVLLRYIGKQPKPTQKAAQASEQQPEKQLEQQSDKQSERQPDPPVMEESMQKLEQGRLSDRNPTHNAEHPTN